MSELVSGSVNREEFAVDGYSAGRVLGPLAPYAAGFAVGLREQGYRPRSVSCQLELMAHLSRWLAERGVEPDGLTVEITEQFLEVRRAGGVSLRSWRALDPLVGYLRGLGVIPKLAASAVTAVDRLVAEYRDYLLRERGLTAGSVAHWERIARLFLTERPEPLEAALQRLSGGEVTAFVVAHCGPGGRSGASAKTLTSGLRTLLRFLHLSGRVTVPLAQAVPSAAGWRLSSLPRALESEQVERLLSSCDCSTLVGRRDHAILVLLARLGLRACEVARLCLDDINWRDGEVTIRGKGAASERLPLPHDAGEAVVSYLRDGRPRVDCREVFVTVHAPLRPLSPAAVVSVVGYACDRAGMQRVGPHRLRHTLACDLLRAGTPLAQIAPILRHASVATTAVYAKVDRNALRALARPWPTAGGA
ncbi:MAG: site-specific integrase, partial [Solirubrobacteraceae bacterium]